MLCLSSIIAQYISMFNKLLIHNYNQNLALVSHVHMLLSKKYSEILKWTFPVLADIDELIS